MSKITILNNKNCRLETSDYDFFNKLRRHLSYKLVGVEYTQAYKNGWDGINYLLSKNGTFLAGLLKKVLKFCNENNIKYELIDKRINTPDEKEIDISEKLKQLDWVPRDYQAAILDATVKSAKGIVRACTGSGKTLCASMITAKFNKPTIIYVIGLDLLGQFHDTFTNIFDEEIGYVGDGVCNIKRITIASIWTVGRALDLKAKDLEIDDGNDKEKFNDNDKIKIQEMLKAAKIHILDECHVCNTSTIKEIHKFINPERIYGLSGTPFRDDGSDLFINGILGEQIINVPASDLIERKILVQPTIKFLSVPKISTYGRTYHDIYKEYVVENNIRNEMVVSNTKMLIEKGYSPLVLFKTIVHGEVLFKMLRDTGVKCELLSGKDKIERRQEVKDMFNNGEIDCIIASSIFELGVDIPKISALVNAGGSKSTIRTLQKIGRTIRGYPGKDRVAIVDFYDNVRYLKEHAMRRYKIYSSESGFIVKPCNEMLW